MQSKEIKEVIVSDRGSITGNIMQTILVGLSAYEVAVKNGFVGTEQEWLDSLMGESVEVSVIKDTREEYVLSFTVGEDTIITPNLKGNVELTPEQLQVVIQNVEAIILEDIDNRYVQKEDGKSLVDDTEIERLKDVHNYDDEQIKQDISEIESQLEDKAEKEHTHKVEDIEDFPSSMPASDVYDWAKQETKPTYTKSEVGLSNVDNTRDIDKPLSNAMMEALEDMDGIIEGHTDNEDIHVTAEEKSSWDNKSDFSGSYNDLSDLPQAETEDIDFSGYFK